MDFTFTTLDGKNRMPFNGKVYDMREFPIPIARSMTENEKKEWIKEWNEEGHLLDGEAAFWKINPTKPLSTKEYTDNCMEQIKKILPEVDVLIIPFHTGLFDALQKEGIGISFFAGKEYFHFHLNEQKNPVLEEEQLCYLYGKMACINEIQMPPETKKMLPFGLFRFITNRKLTDFYYYGNMGENEKFCVNSPEEKFAVMKTQEEEKEYDH